jgi:hypothetical protein
MATENSDPDIAIQDPLDQPAELEKAKIHGRAQKILNLDNFDPKGSKQLNLNLDKIEYCDCCLLPEETKGIIEPYPFTVSIEKLASAGPGTYLYFYYFRFIIFMFLIGICMVGIPQAYTSYNHYRLLKDFCSRNENSTYCKEYLTVEKPKIREYLKMISSTNIHHYKNILHTNPLDTVGDDYMVRYELINFVCMAVMLIANVFFVVDVYNNIVEQDYMMITPSDYTLMIKNAPGYKDKEQLKAALEIVRIIVIF